MPHAPIVRLRPNCTLDPDVPVWVYGDKDANDGAWSVVQHHRGIGVAHRMVLRDVRFVVQRDVLAGVARGMRNIHAFAEGWLDVWPVDAMADAQQVRYRPDFGFYVGDEANHQPLRGARVVYFDRVPMGAGLDFGPAVDPGGPRVSL